MPVRIFCKCGEEITQEIPAWDIKTRSVYWMDQHTPSCSACLSGNTVCREEAIAPGRTAVKLVRKMVAS